MKLVWKVLFCGFLGGLLCNSAPLRSEQVLTTLNLAYGPNAAEKGDLYYFGSSDRPKPALLLIHGGGWTEGTRHTYDLLARLFASMGFVVFNIDYRLASKIDAGSRWPAQIVDAQLAVRFLRAHALSYGVDSQRIGAFGESAGAHLAVLLGSMEHPVVSPEANLYPRESSKIIAIIDEYGPTDPTQMGSRNSVEALFGTSQPSSAQIATALPIPLINGNSAAVYILHGRFDNTVPYDQSIKLEDALTENKVPSVFVSFNGGHGFEGVSNADVVQIQSSAFSWLAKRLGAHS